jgi:short-subunit dehydrogenase
VKQAEIIQRTLSAPLSRRLKEKYGPWAVITGASSGIGHAFAIGLGAAGLNLVLVARRREALEKLAGDLQSRFGVAARVIAADLAHETGIDTVQTGTHDLDVGLLVASAGFGTSGPFLDGALAQELEMLQVNCGALVALSQHFGQRFAARGRGGLVLMSSIVGLQGTPYAAHYAATKAYVQALGEALHVELAPLGVDVIASAPGPVNSGFAARAGQRMGAALEPVDVVEPTLKALGRRATVLPGLLTKLLVYSLALLPRQLRVRIMGRVMHGMTRHRSSGSLDVRAGST